MPRLTHARYRIEQPDHADHPRVDVPQCPEPAEVGDGGRQDRQIGDGAEL